MYNAETEHPQDSGATLSCGYKKTESRAEGSAVNTYCEECGELLYSRS